MADTQTDTSSSPSIGDYISTTIPKDVTEGLGKLERSKIGAEGEAARGVSKQLDTDRARVDKAYNNEGISPNDIKPWNEAEEKKKFETDPVQAFGSLGSVFGIIASAFTHAPMENAMNASAAAINAVKAGNDQEYTRAHAAWKENMDLVLKRHQMMHENYQDATELMRTNLAAGEAKMRMLASQYGDQKSLFLLEHGMLPELWQAMDARNNSITGAAKAVDEITKEGMQQKFFAQEVDGIKKDVQDPIAQAAMIRTTYQKYFGKGPGSIEEQALDQANAESIHKTGKPLDAQHIMQLHKNFSKSADSVAAQDASALEDKTAQLLQEAADKGKPISKFEAYSQAKQALKLAAGGATLDDTTLNYMAEQLLEGNSQILSGLGWGAAASNNRTALRNRATKLAIEQGLSPQQANAKVASFMGERRGESALGQREAQITSAITTAQNTAPRVLETSKNVDRTRYPSLNKILLAAEQGTGDPDVVRFGIAVNTLINNYARALGAGSAQLTNSARHEAQKMLDTAWSAGQIEAAVDQMRIELAAELKGAKAAHGAFQEGYGKPAETARPDPLGIR